MRQLSQPFCLFSDLFSLLSRLITCSRNNAVFTCVSLQQKKVKVAFNIAKYPVRCRASVLPRPRKYRVRRGFHDNLARFFRAKNLKKNCFSVFFKISMQLYYNDDINGRLALQ